MRFIYFHLKSTTFYESRATRTDWLFFSSDCSVLLETCPPLSPAKMFAFMKKRESRAVHQDVHQAHNTTRALFTESGCAVVWNLLVLLPCSCYFISHVTCCHLTLFAQVNFINLVMRLNPLWLKRQTLTQRVMGKVRFVAVSPAQTQLRASPLWVLLKLSPSPKCHHNLF